MPSIVSLNTWKGDGAYGRRLELMADGLRALAPDVVLLQEALAAPDLGADTAAHLAAALGMTAVSAPARYKPRAVEGRWADSSSGLAVLTRLPVRAAGSLPLPGDDADGDRTAQWLELALPQGVFGIVNLHLTHLRGRDDLRRHQLDTALAGLATERWCGAVIGGDFNAPLDRFAPVALAGWHLLDCRAAAGRAPAATLMDSADPARCLDHLLLAQPGTAWRVADFHHALTEQVDGIGASDHTAVIARLAAMPPHG